MIVWVRFPYLPLCGNSKKGKGGQMFDEDDIQYHEDNNNGFCTHCSEWTREGGTEPDAENYPCDDCGKDTVVGAMIYAITMI